MRDFLIILCVCGLAACTTTGAPPPEDSDYEFVFAEEYRIGVGDDLTVNVYGHEDVTTTVSVRPDGKITMPIAGDILVGGEVPETVAAEIKTALSKYIRDPIVTVSVTSISGADYQSRVRITGAVVNPQSVAFQNGMTVMDVVLEAGGLNEFAAASRAKLYREGREPIGVRLDHILSGRDLSTNVRLRPGDVISVPERTF